jgi:hypothetical protein
MCDASAAVGIGGRILVADDEDNLIRVYGRDGGDPEDVLDPGEFLELERRSPEVDIEASARVGDVIYWISSHGRNSKGKPRPNRLRLFATTVERGADGRHRLAPRGRPYVALLEALVADPGLARFDLASAAARAPKEPGALNIEGLAAAGDGTLLVGFRNPIPDGRALIVPLLNPADVVAGVAPRFGAPALLDLGGLGIRSLDRGRDDYVIGAGPFGDERKARLFRWSGDAGTAPAPFGPLDLGNIVPEAVVVDDEAGVVQLLSDDGPLAIDGRECKRLRDPGRKRFRGVRVAWPAAEAWPAR